MSFGKVKQNIVVLTASNLIIGLIEFVFNMYLSRILGAEGLGLLSLVAPINSLFLSFMTEGLVVTISKMSARYQHYQDYAAMDGMIKISTAFSFLWSVLLSGLVWLTAGPIASGFLGDPSLRYPILSVCPLMILMSISNIVKGHFLGLAKIKIPSAINISEKILRFPILYTLIRFCLNHTDFPPVTLVYLCYAIGEMQSVLLLMIYYKKTLPKSPPQPISLQTVKNTLLPLIRGAAPICLTQCLLESVNAFSSVIVKSRLCSIGYSAAESLSLLGKYKGMVFPLMNYPMILVSSTCSIVVPKVATMMTAGKGRFADRLLLRCLLVAFVIGLFTGAVFWIFADEMGVFFYKQEDLALMIRLSGICSPLLYVTAATTSLLISIGQEAQSFRNSLFQQLLLLIFLILFTGIPALNIYGYIAAAALSNAVLLVQNLYFLKLHRST
ncbi:MAG: oligosaccharide flippase family protein [Anaerovoracaceae bacterium]